MSFLDEAKRRQRGERGKTAEKEVQKLLMYMGNHADFDWERIYDARSAGGKFPARAGDFSYFYPGVHGLMEVKEVDHDYRLPKKNLTQLPKLHRRKHAGGETIILVLHTTTGLWRCPSLEFLWKNKDAPSWDLRGYPTFVTASWAVASMFGGRLEGYLG